MKRALSLIACFIIAIVLIRHRVSYPPTGEPVKVTTWDALGYYMYLPGICIYKDVTQLEWLPAIDSQYKVTGGETYQARKIDNGNYAFKYLGGVALLQTPFFLVAHFIASRSVYPADGFSAPYQYAIAWGAVIYCILAFFLLRSILLRYFNDLTACITLLLLALATNLIQYVSVDSAMSHAYIFPLYVLVLYTTIKWHDNAKPIWAILTGLIIGLATISRPTEAVMLFIPLLWNTHTKESASGKWKMVRSHRSHIAWAIIGGFIGILPQLIYWKIATGSFIYDVGSKWDFANPHFRVLFGFEKGWFIYTPVTLLFIAGLFFMKNRPFQKSVLWFCLLNIYIVIAWNDWQYGGSYSTRALVQSYPVFALPLAAFVERINKVKWKWLFYPVCIYLIIVNLFQVWQYNENILHYRDMNRQYYGRIYLNANPTPVDMSALDSCEIPRNISSYRKTIISIDDSLHIDFNEHSPSRLFYQHEFPCADSSTKETWIRIDADMKVDKGFYCNYLSAEVSLAKESTKRVRLYNPISEEGRSNHYAFFIKVPPVIRNECTVRAYINGTCDFECSLGQFTVTKLEK